MMGTHVEGMGLVRLNQGLIDWLDSMLHSHGQGLLWLLKLGCLPGDRLGVGSNFHWRANVLNFF